MSVPRESDGTFVDFNTPIRWVWAPPNPEIDIDMDVAWLLRLDTPDGVEEFPRVPRLRVVLNALGIVDRSDLDDPLLPPGVTNPRKSAAPLIASDPDLENSAAPEIVSDPDPPGSPSTTTEGGVGSVTNDTPKMTDNAARRATIDKTPSEQKAA